MAARIDTVCDLVAAAIRDGLEPGDGTRVTAAEPAPAVLDPDRADALDGRTVFVFAAGYAQVAQVSRAAQLNAYKVTVLVVDRYADPGEPDDAWARAQKAWVQDEVYDPLSASRNGPVAGYHCETAEVVEALAADLLRTLKLFWSQCDFEFRRIE